MLKRFTIILVIVFTLAIAGWGCFLLFSQKPPENANPVSFSTSTTTTQNPTTSDVYFSTIDEVIPTSTSSVDISQIQWEIYENKQFGYRIKYPKDWYYKEYSIGTPLAVSHRAVYYIDFSPDKNYDDFKNNSISISLGMWDANLPSAPTFDEWLATREINSSPTFKTGKPLMIKDKKAMIYFQEENKYPYKIEIWLQKVPLSYEFLYFDPLHTKQYLLVFKEMINSFEMFDN